jgi:hypothetical protein
MAHHRGDTPHPELEALRRGRRVLSGVVSLAAIALVMARVRGTEADAGNLVGSIASVAFVVSCTLLALVWRKEHVANEAGFAARAAQQLALMKLELAEKKGSEDSDRRGAESANGEE